ncbi:MAG: hypothetical protein EA344_08575 [Alkalicoccus sp.]|nr:MAG: hypothetical protein EA344_08575 [Alkalicoccus sp.]
MLIKLSFQNSYSSQCISSYSDKSLPWRWSSAVWPAPLTFHLFIKEKGFNKGTIHSRKLLSVSLLQPQGRLRGDKGRGEDPFRKEAAEPGPPGKCSGRRKQEALH